MPLWKWDPILPVQGTPPVLFLDRDGVVIADRHYLSDPDLVEVLPGVPGAMRRARQAGYLVVGVSNQSGLGRGRFTEADFAGVMTRLDQLLQESGAPFDGFFYCPHEPDAGCACRKPRPGMLEELSSRVAWKPEESWVVGDKESDVALGRQAGLGGCLVRTGYGKEQEGRVREAYRADPRVLVEDDVPAAVEAILRAEGVEEK